jgi:site-specific DNA recombinase
VVHKVDRLTRSLANFAKLVELFDAHDVSFVSVTPTVQYDDVHGSIDPQCAPVLCPVRAGGHLRAHPRQDRHLQRKGIWVGGPLPFGYELKDEKLVVVEEEAERVRLIFSITRS